MPLLQRPSALFCLAVFLGTVGSITPRPTSAATVSPPNQSAAVFTLPEVIRIVIEHNPTLRAAERNREAAAANVTTAKAIPNPRLDSTLGQNTPRLPSSLGGHVSGWGVSQLIENPALRGARMEAASFGQVTSSHIVANTANELVAQVRIKAFEHLLRKEEARAASDALNLLEQIRTRVKVRVESGEAARYEIIKADAEVINARQRYQTASLQVEQSALAINRLAAGRMPAQWTLSENLADAIEAPALAQIQQAAQDSNPEVKTLLAEVARREAKLREAQAGRWPGLELRYGQLRDTEIRQGTLSASLQIPLFDQRAGPIGEANAELARAKTLLDGKRAELTQQILLAWKNMEIARIRVTALSTGAVREAEAALRVAEAAYRFGERGILDVLDAQRVLRQVNADLLDARFQVQAAGVDLDFLAGLYADAYQNPIAKQ